MYSLVTLKNFLADVSTDLTYYRQIFGSDRNVEVLREFSDWVFSNYQQCLINNIYSKLARLLDPKSSCGKDNLSFSYVISTCSLSEDLDIQKSLEDIKNKYKSTGLKSYRNKVLSHNDAHTVLSGTQCGVSLNDESLDEFLSSLWDLFSLLKYKTGQEDLIPKYSTEIIIPAEMDGETFVLKLQGRM
ncbi:hypothetical protein KUW19_10095 [Ferrimonas balearica]|uniref:AbiU2 domain-containing protein n=1 Tax=Ferrimonas balearica TaxID=44012 RepID=UPI001C941E3E|nr:hypothetical protein [Ferrimonas balearica]MBY6106824.1 hypothetical protein [Ferrimonas balearica]